MWSLSSLRRLNSSYLIGINGGFKCISHVPSSFSARFGDVDNEMDRNSKPHDNLTGPMENMSSQDNLRGPMANVSSQDIFRGAMASMSSQNNFRGANVISQDNLREPMTNFGNRNIVKEAMNSLRVTGPRNFDRWRNTRKMDFVKGVLNQDQFSQYSIERDAHFVLIQLKRNNTHINLTDAKGDTKFWTASGNKNVGGGGKVTRYAAEATAEYVGRRVKEMGVKSVVMRVKGFTHFKKKKQAIMSFKEGFSNSRRDRNPIVYIEDVTRRPHNGCRLPKKRRI